MGFGLQGPLGAQTCVFKSGDRRLRIVLQSGVIPDSGHWIMEENPAATIAIVRTFLAR
jgi:pimeloyl-ACP methyl ester carboxylesterase